jgi:hypothetical protein
MTLIEGIGDDVITLLFILFTVIIIIISWLSTNVREFAFPANLLVIERRSRRLYTASLNGNLVNTHRLSSTASTSTSDNNNNSQSEATSLSNGHSVNNNANTAATDTSNSARGIITSTRSSPSERTQELELVNEIVEQALVDNLLDGEYYSANDIELIQNHHQSHVRQRTPPVNASTSTSDVESSTTMTTTTTPLVVDHSEAKVVDEDSANNLSNTNENLINILIRFVSEKERRIQARPNDTILILKKQYFGQELATNKIVRFIYQGQFLCDKNTVKSYNIKDQTTIHCHITTKLNQPQPPEVNLNQEQSSSSSGLRLRAVNTILNDDLVVSTTATNEATANNINNNPSNGIVPNLIVPPTLPETRNPMRNTTTTIISIDLNNLLLPLFAVLLGVSWYFRVNFKHFFSPLSTLILVIFTFIYALFLFNNIHSTSSIAANNFMTHSRILRRRPFRSATPPESPIAQNQ